VSDWEDVSLGDVADALVGFAFKSSRFSDDPSDVRLVRGVNVGQGFLDWSRTAYWSAEDCERYARYELADGDVVLAMDRPWIEAGLKRARIRNGALPALLVQRVMRLRGTKRVRTSFLHHLLASQAFSNYIKPIVTGVNVPHISPAQIAAFRFRLPSSSEQDAICSVLDALEEHIENNGVRVALLEQMAQAIYREWFLHFRYPGHEDEELVDSPLGPIPAGWEVLPVSRAVEINPRVTGSRGSEVPFVAMGDLDPGLMLVQPTSKRKLGGGGTKFERHDTLFARITPSVENGKTGFVQFLDDGDVAMGSTEFLVLRGRRISPYSTYLLARREDLRLHAVGSMSGASGRQRVSSACFDTFEIAVPPPVLEQRFADCVTCAFTAVETLSQANKRLIRLRNLLLPRLVTGAIDTSKLDLDALLGESAA
jgi:type I restriction enzyme, S subunit